MAYDQNAADAIAELADARHELDVLRGGIANLRQWFSLALGELTQAQAERDEARRAAASWEEWGQGWKGQAEGSRTARDKAWAELDQVRAELVTAVREVADLRALFDLQWKRMAEATERWRAEDPEARALVMPDLGDLLQWLMADADRLRAELAALAPGWESPAALQAAYSEILAMCEQAEAERDQLRQHILDIDAHATPYGDIPDEPGWVGTYLVTAGALHRALGKIGHSAPRCEAEARLAAIEQHARDAGARLLVLQAERGELALALEQAEVERDRRGDELKRAQDVIEALGGPQ